MQANDQDYILIYHNDTPTLGANYSLHDETLTRTDFPCSHLGSYKIIRRNLIFITLQGSSSLLPNHKAKTTDVVNEDTRAITETQSQHTNGDNTRSINEDDKQNLGAAEDAYTGISETQSQDSDGDNTKNIQISDAVEDDSRARTVNGDAEAEAQLMVILFPH